MSRLPGINKLAIDGTRERVLLRLKLRDYYQNETKHTAHTVSSQSLNFFSLTVPILSNCLKMAVVLAPVTPKTPSGLFAAMALSPTCATGLPTAVPTLHFSPATPDDNSPFYPSSPSPSPTLPATSSTSGPPKPTHRSLASNEARQLTLLLTQHLFPVRNSHKGLMSESIVLAEKLHEAGLRWDTKRRVMGMHLRGIWEESQRLANGRTVGGHGPME